MTWTWRYTWAEHANSAEPPAGTEPAAPAATRSDAESWIGENWRGLLAAGVVAVTLLEDDTTIYTMPLTAE